MSFQNNNKVQPLQKKNKSASYVADGHSFTTLFYVLLYVYKGDQVAGYEQFFMCNIHDLCRGEKTLNHSVS